MLRSDVFFFLFIGKWMECNYISHVIKRKRKAIKYVFFLRKAHSINERELQ